MSNHFVAGKSCDLEKRPIHIDEFSIDQTRNAKGIDTSLENHAVTLFACLERLEGLAQPRLGSLAGVDVGDEGYEMKRTSVAVALDRGCRPHPGPATVLANVALLQSDGS